MKKLLTLLAVLVLAGGTAMAKNDKTLDVLPLMCRNFSACLE